MADVVAALSYAKRQWPVIPLHTMSETGGCTCGAECSSPAKHPRNPHGLSEASTDATTIQGWWDQWPNSNIGIATGQASGLLVVDVDRKSGGLESWASLQDIHGRVETLTSLTGGGGNHYLFSANGHQLRNTAGHQGRGGLHRSLPIPSC